jgi:hypothetical protein
MMMKERLENGSAEYAGARNPVRKKRSGTISGPALRANEEEVLDKCLRALILT